MTRTHWLVSTAAVALTVGAALATPALSQSVLSSPPPRDYTLDARGVDLVTGSFNYTATEVAIGPQGQGRPGLYADVHAGRVA